MASKVLVFDELQENAQVMIATQSGGNVIGRATDMAAGVGGFSVIHVSPADHNFNGDGSGGAVQLPSAQTIVVCDGANASGIDFRMKTAGVTSGYVVAFAISGFDPGEVTIFDEDDVSLTIVNTSSTGSGFNKLPFPVLYFDGGWFLLRSDIHIS